MAKKIARTRSENRPIASASSDGQRQRRRRCPSATAPQLGPERVQRDRDAVGADAEEHRVGEGHDAGVAEQQVVAARPAR